MGNVIFEYTLLQAMDDGVLHPLGWADGKPLVVTGAIVKDLSHKEMRQVFTEFFDWQRDIEPTLKEEERMFSKVASNGQVVWVIDDGAAVTLLNPSDY